MPRVRFGQVHILNCLYSSKATSGCVGLGYEAQVLVEKTVFRDISKKIYKEYNDKDEAHRGIIELRDVLYLNSKSAESNGAVFTPPYTIESLAVGDVEAKVKAEAGATLTVKKP